MADKDDASKINIYSLISPFPLGDQVSKINIYSQIGASANYVESAKINIYTLIGPPVEPPITSVAIQYHRVPRD